ncbi:hypothetical protein N805_12540 [Pseudomonas putida S13.1.2]|uniref:Uncharacterized protein n=1 Tax=Pseudomonas putida S13.1.2 TaxID=1384061 RepID=A0AAU8RYR2_PSEPU|nr:hypothetical protein N805_12540 [Pseudomonas putida S13.1.2]
MAAESRCIRGQQLFCRHWLGLSNRVRIDVIIPIISWRLNKTIIARHLAILINFRITLWRAFPCLVFTVHKHLS